MIIKFIENYAKLIVSVPADVAVTKEVIDDTFAEITIVANSVDIGKLIGKNGNMINSLKNNFQAGLQHNFACFHSKFSQQPNFQHIFIIFHINIFK